MRRTPLRRKTRLRQRRQKPRRTSAGRDASYRSLVRTMACAIKTCLERGRLTWWTRCAGRIHAHHAGRHPAGAKACDSTCVALCRSHHAELHELRGVAKGMTRDDVRELEDELVAETRLALGYKEAA